MSCLVVGLGQELAGDDAVGLRVADALAGRALPPGVRAVRAADPAALPLLLDGPARAVLVDALLDPDGPPGRVVALDPGALAARPALGAHGLDVPGALALARAVGASGAGDVTVVAVTIGQAARGTRGLSAAVEAAVEPAAAEALRRATREGRA